MEEKYKRHSHWLRKAAICLAFFGFLTARDARGFGLPPVISVPPLGISVLSGDTATFTTVIGVSLTPLSVSWYFGPDNLKNNKDINVSTVTDGLTGITTSTLTISNVSSLDAGNYYVVAKNNGGQVTNNAVLVVLSLSVPDPASIVTSGCGKTNNGFRLQLHKAAQSNCVIEATTDFVHWAPIATNTSGSTNFSYLDSAATNLLTRYYRVRYQ
jgi:hypothetical protein